jgi:hypothetical protein
MTPDATIDPHRERAERQAALQAALQAAPHHVVVAGDSVVARVPCGPGCPPEHGYRKEEESRGR